MKKIHIVISCFFLSTVFFIGGVLFSNFLIKENKNIEETKGLERKDITKIKSKESSEIDTDLTEANNIAKRALKNVYIHNVEKLNEFMWYVVRHAFTSKEQWSNDKYSEIIQFLNKGYSEGSIDWRWLTDLVGTEGQEAILYIFDHYQDWHSVFVKE